MNPELADMSRWGAVNLEDLTSAAVKTFKKRQRAVALVLSGQTIYSAGRAAGLAPATVSKLMKRALCTTESQPLPALSAALVPNTRVAKENPPPTNSSAVGYRGQFGRLLQDNPEIEAHIWKTIKGSSRHAPGQRHLTLVALHHAILDILRKKGYGLDDYPFCTCSRGFESLRKCYHRLILEFEDHKFGQISKAGSLRTKDNTGSLLPGLFEFDHHKLDVESADVMPDSVRRAMRAVRIPRFWLGLAVEKSSTAIMGYSYDYSLNPTQESVLHCLDMIYRGTDALDQGILRSSKQMIPAVPADFGSELRIIPREVRLDNAWAHFAQTVIDFCVTRFGATIAHGLPAMPLARQLVESIFRQLEIHIHTLPSTVGTGILDKRREPSKLRGRVPNLTNQTLLEIVHKLIALHNTRPKDYLGNISPLDYLRQSIAQGAIPVQAEKSWFDETSPFVKTIKRRVHLYKGITPHINMLYSRYSGPGLSPSLTGDDVYIKYNFLDIRYADAYRTDGTHISKLSAHRRLLSEPISERTIKKIKKKGFLDKFAAGDPIAEYTEHLQRNIDNPESIREYMRLRQIRQIFDDNQASFDDQAVGPIPPRNARSVVAPIEWMPRQPPLAA